MNTPRCFQCQQIMTRHGRTSSGRQRWRCRACQVTQVVHLDRSAKHLHEFLAWLLSGKRQVDMPGGGRSFRRRCAPLWSIWPFSPVIDEVHSVVFVDGIYLGRKAVVLIAQSQTHVLGWYVARSENTRAWVALISRIAPPDMVVCDGASGFERARKVFWPDTRVQRCTFHVFGLIKKATTTRPKLSASRQLYDLGVRLLRVHTPEDAIDWLGRWNQWCDQWRDFLAERTEASNGSWVYTHERLLRARNAINKLINSMVLFTYLDPTWEAPMPATNNRIEEATNAPLRQLLRDHRGMSLSRRIKAVFWWCYIHTENPLPPAQIIATMPTDTDIQNAWQKADPQQRNTTSIPT